MCQSTLRKYEQIHTAAIKFTLTVSLTRSKLEMTEVAVEFILSEKQTYRLSKYFAELLQPIR